MSVRESDSAYVANVPYKVSVILQLSLTFIHNQREFLSRCNILEEYQLCILNFKNFWRKKLLNVQNERVSVTKRALTLNRKSSFFERVQHKEQYYVDSSKKKRKRFIVFDTIPYFVDQMKSNCFLKRTKIETQSESKVIKQKQSHTHTHIQNTHTKEKKK